MSGATTRKRRSFLNVVRRTTRYVGNLYNHGSTITEQIMLGAETSDKSILQEAYRSDTAATLVGRSPTEAFPVG